MERHRADLRVFTYRMLGSLLESERLVAQAFSQVSLQLKTQNDTGPVSVPAYGDTLNICLKILQTQPRRTLPSLSYPPADPSKQPAESKDPSVWLEPFPDELSPDIPYEGGGYAAREMISLPFIAALQFVRPQERAIMILCDTIGWQPAQVADLIGISDSQVTGMLAQARGEMARHYHAQLGRREPPSSPNATALLMQYLYPWETANLDGLMSRLTDEVTMQVLPSPSWYKGRAAVQQYLASHAFASGARGRWRLLPRRANGQFAFGTYQRDDVGLEYAAHSIQVLTFEGDLVSEIISFANRSLFPAFNLRSRVIAQGRMPTQNDQD